MPVSSHMLGSIGGATRLGLGRSRLFAGERGALPDRLRRMLARPQVAMTLAVVAVLLALFARLMTFPLRRDEHMFMATAILLPEGSIYRDLGFNHLPNLPLLLHGLLAVSGDSLVLTGRLVVFAGWIATVVAITRIAQHATRDFGVLAFVLLVFVANPVIVGPAGMMVTNNFLPIPFALFGLYCLLIGLDGQLRPALLFLSGALLAIAAGFKANYLFLIPPVALTALLVPTTLPFTERLRRVTLPLAVGGVIGGLPTLAYLAADPQGFFAHVLNYHLEPHRAFWAAAPEPKVIGLREKMLLAEELWLGGATILLPLAMVVFCLLRVDARRGDEPSPKLFDWPILLTLGLVGLAAAMSFLPTPSFPQYFVPAIPFAIVLVLLLHGRLGPDARRRARPVLVAMSAVAALAALPRLLVDIPKLASTKAWTTTAVERVGDDIRKAAGPGKVATLAPLYPLEGGLDIYPELAAGPFVYRVADFIPPADREHYRLVSPSTLPRLLDSDPPSAILVGLNGDRDRAFVEYALARGYTERPVAGAETRYGTLTLYVRPTAPSPGR